LGGDEKFGPVVDDVARQALETTFSVFVGSGAEFSYDHRFAVGEQGFGHLNVLVLDLYDSVVLDADEVK
jgi:hypothetical protein